jgi:hypothetical protein
MSTFQRITYRPEGATRARNVILKNVTTDHGYLRGIEVNKEGDEVTKPGVDERVHLIEQDLVTKRTPLRMDNHYGTLVEGLGCDCMTEEDPDTGEEKVLTHSLSCPLHPEYEPET